MQKFRVQNYKKINDTGWIECGNITTFVGKNEAGKSALFRGLSKINPSDNEKYDGLKEFPRKRFTAEFEQKSWPVCSVEFKLDDSDVNELAKIHPELKKVLAVIVTRYYSNKYTLEFKPRINIPNLSTGQYHTFLNSCKTKINNITAPDRNRKRLSQIKTAMNETFNSTIQSIKHNDPSKPISAKTIQKISDYLTSNLNERWEQKLFSDMVNENNKLLSSTQSTGKIDLAEDWVLRNMPQYIYFDRYDVIDSAIHIGEFITKIRNDPENPRLRTTKCLFQHTGLDIQKISALDPYDERGDKSELTKMADERHIRMSSASVAMTEKFANWWEQRKHKFRYQVDGDFFRVWVSDDLDSSEIELDQRSAGMQYFFSFYLVFLVEASDYHMNSVLLLDEPGLHYHGTAQRKTVAFLQKISESNQLLYSTHSPFMIDGDRLQDVRIVYEDAENGHTLVSSNAWPADPDSLFPLQAGLGYALAQTLFYSKYNLVVEGITDYLILKAMSDLLSEKNMKALNADVVIVPSGGTRNMMPLASMLVGNKLKITVLLDGDAPGIEKGKHLKEKLGVSCMFVSSFAGKDGAGIEDLFPEEFYLQACKEAYPGKEIRIDKNREGVSCITTRIKKSFERSNFGDFEKMKVTRVLVDWIQKDYEENKIPDDTCRKFDEIFASINASLNRS